MNGKKPKELCGRCKQAMRKRYDKRSVKAAKVTNTPKGNSPASTARAFGEIGNDPIVFSPEYTRLVNSILREKRDRELR